MTTPGTTAPPPARTPPVLIGPPTGLPGAPAPNEPRSEIAPPDPRTALLVDPRTGFVIQPSSGMLINPETGTLIDPRSPSPSATPNGR
jgi:hypothetical protein